VLYVAALVSTQHSPASRRATSTQLRAENTATLPHVRHGLTQGLPSKLCWSNFRSNRQDVISVDHQARRLGVKKHMPPAEVRTHQQTGPASSPNGAPPEAAGLLARSKRDAGEGFPYRRPPKARMRRDARRGTPLLMVWPAPAAPPHRLAQSWSATGGAWCTRFVREATGGQGGVCGLSHAAQAFCV
jgi:hypothetical protein